MKRILGYVNWKFLTVFSLILLMGCAQQTTTPTSGGNVETYTVQEGDSITLVKANHDSQTYTLDMNLLINFSKTRETGFYEDYSDAEIVSEGLEVACNTVHQIVYNYSSLKSPEKMPLVQKIPSRVWEEYEPTSVSVVAYNPSQSEEYGSCDVARGGVNKNVLLSGQAQGEEVVQQTSVTSIDFKRDYEDMTFYYRARKLGSGEPDIRVDISPYSAYDNYTIILKGSESVGWQGVEGDLKRISEGFSDTWDSYRNSINTLVDELRYEDCLDKTTCTILGDAEVYEIRINPELSDSVFQIS